ncbi:MAG TPA: carbohydrate ABC transporter permease, partial [Acidimicrobiia bacterium]|nr:carbohydrate ABC transporter permease [Acidimicrobiia bacterium]
MKRYSWRTALNELGMIAVGVLFAFPLYILVNLSVRGPNDTSSPLALTTNPTIENYVAAWHEAGLGPAIL